MNVFLLYPDRDAPAEKTLPLDSQSVIDVLALNTLFNTMADGDPFLFEVSKQTFLSSLDGPDQILYRQGVVQDCLKNPAVVRRIYTIPLQAIENKDSLWMGVFNNHTSSILSGGLEMLVMFVDLLKELKQVADQHADQFESDGFQRFFQMVQEELDDAYFAEVETHLKALKFDSGVFVSAELGPGNEGTKYTLHRPDHGGKGWMKRWRWLTRS